MIEFEISKRRPHRRRQGGRVGALASTPMRRLFLNQSKSNSAPL
jgi:hypothetical protein